jgi:IS5 family transposase
VILRIQEGKRERSAMIARLVEMKKEEREGKEAHLQVVADGKIDNDGDAERVEERLRTDTGQLKDLRRANDSSAAKRRHQATSASYSKGKRQERGRKRAKTYARMTSLVAVTVYFVPCAPPAVDMNSSPEAMADPLASLVPLKVTAVAW